MNASIDWLLARLAENSTWRGIILLLTAAGVILSPDQANAITAAGLAIVGLINVIRKAPTNETSTTVSSSPHNPPAP
jgi:hypothetical protein